MRCCPFPSWNATCRTWRSGEPYRQKTYVSQAAKGLISGFGAQSYALAIEAAADLVKA